MNRLPAKTGWLWVKEGFAVFRKQPLALVTLFISYLFVMLAIGLVPVLGQVVPLILVPVFSLAFLQASDMVHRGEKVSPRLLFAGFRSPLIKRLLMLGVVQLVITMAILGISVWIDGGMLWKIVSGEVALDPKTVAGSNILAAMMTAGVLYVPATMAFWYAAPLVAWRDMGIGKALFYSFFAMLRESRAFLVYGLGWMVVGMLLPTILSLLLAVLIGSVMPLVAVMMPMSLLLTVALYCSFYATYADVFERPAEIALTDADA